MRRSLCSLALLFATIHAQSQTRWVGTWAAANVSMETTRPGRDLLGAQELTLRQTVHLSQGGKELRITLTNEFGTTPLHIAATHVAFLAVGSKIVPGTDHIVTFAGQPDLVIPPGEFRTSDSVQMNTPIFSDIVISSDIPQQPLAQATFHANAWSTTYWARGNETAASQLETSDAPSPGVVSHPFAPFEAASHEQSQIVTSPTSRASEKESGAAVLKTTSWYFLKNVEVPANKHSGAIIAFGDSITDGHGSTVDTNRRYPDELAVRVAETRKTASLSVLNVGIGGNRVLHDDYGPSGVERFSRDVLTQPGASDVILLEGINDVGNMLRSQQDLITAQELIAAYTQMAQRAHAQGLRIFGATLTPYAGAAYFSPQGEQIRQEVNAFFRSNTVLDGCIDFDKTLRDPDHPDRLRAQYDLGDHLHPSDAGYAAMATAVSLKLMSRH